VSLDVGEPYFIWCSGIQETKARLFARCDFTSLVMVRYVFGLVGGPFCFVRKLLFLFQASKEEQESNVDFALQHYGLFGGCEVS